MSVKVYSTPTCPWCTRAKEYLTEKNVPFVDVDVSMDQRAAQEMVQKTGQMGVPVIEVHGRFIVGFDISAIEQALAAG